METLKCIETRRSIRKYAARPVDAETVRALIRTASMAPSWKNSQTVRYYALDSVRKDAFAEACCGVYANNCARAKACGVLVALVTERGISGYDPDGTASTPLGSHWESFDAGIAAQTLCLAAHDMGLGSLIMGIYDPQKAAEELELPENMQVSALICLGWADEEPAARPRKSVDSLLTWVK